MSAAELYMQVHSPITQGYVSPYAASDAEVKAGVVHAEIVRRLNLSEAERELVLIALIDLDQAMQQVSELTRRGIHSFLQFGPKEMHPDEVVFRHGHAHHVLDVFHAMNGTGRYADATRANERQGIRKLC